MAPSHNLDDTLLALADETRRAILARLSEGNARVTTLAEPFDISLNSVSKHIRMLERAQLVRRHVQGREHVLSLNTAPLDEAAAWIAAQQRFWSQRLTALDRALTRRRGARHRARRGKGERVRRPRPTSSKHA
jgi:DNA-binding transcriptional ArsR family regulator